MNGASNLVSILKSAGDSLRLDILAVLKELLLCSRVSKHL